MHLGTDGPFGIVEGLASVLWITGFLFEVVGDYQLMRFRGNPKNKGRLMTSGVRRWTRHPQYFGEAVIWWGYGLFALAAGAWWALGAPVLMTFLLLRVSGISMLERSLRSKPGFREYASHTPAFFPKIPFLSGQPTKTPH
jgi:steroid 5-alpha reductase family enzyme